MKNNPRLILYVAIFGVAFILWQKWQDANRPLIVEEASSSVQTAVPASDGVPSAATGELASSVPVPENMATKTEQLIRVNTDTMTILINPVGGTIERVELLDYTVSKDSNKPLSLLKPTNPNRFILRSGLGSNVKNAAPTHYSPFSSSQTQYQLTDGENSISVPLVWQNEQGVKVTKTYTFKRGNYEFELKQDIENNSDSDWQGFAYQQLVFGEAAAKGGLGKISTFTGGVTSTSEDSYNKIKLTAMQEKPTSISTNEGWVAMIQHYFIGALVPKSGGNYKFYTDYLEKDHILGVVTQSRTVAAGASTSFTTVGYIGPKIQKDLAAVAPKLDKTVDYGILFMLSQPMFKVLSIIYGFIGNWGWAIILMTLLIKLIFFAPSAWAYKSMAKMRRLQPEMARLKERFGEDRQAMSQAMMKLYRQEKVNPASGCLPMLLQIPFFLAFYWVLVESVELRQAPWFAWVQDLSVRDSYFILPLLNATLMFVQQKLNPPPPDPMQAKIMMMLPLVFGFMFMWFPSGLVLYWTVSNAFSIVQQTIMNKRYGEPRKKAIK